MEFESWGKTPRFEKISLAVTITEKIDGTNGQIAFDDDGKMWVGSRNRWLQPGVKGGDNFGFAEWAFENEEELRKLGPGRHYGEWYGRGIGRGYGLQGRRFALFNTFRWTGSPALPTCCEVVPVLFSGVLTDLAGVIQFYRDEMEDRFSLAAPEFAEPEGLVVLFHRDRQRAKVIFDKRGPSPLETMPLPASGTPQSETPVVWQC